MSERIQKNDSRATIRWKLLTGASALALTAYISSGGLARAEDASQPQLWIELGGQLSRLEAPQETFNPPLMDARPSIFTPSQDFEKAPEYSLDEFGSASFRPGDSNWLISASIRYGRSAQKRHVIQQTSPKSAVIYFTNGDPLPPKYDRPPDAQRFADTLAHNSERHTIIDFQAGKDVGLGMFGSSTVSLGVRFAQFQTKSNVSIKSDPDWHFISKYLPPPYATFAHISKMPFAQAFHSNLAELTAWRSFHGIGPSLSWKASTPFAGNPQDGELTVDWAVQAAALFGRQRAKTHHQSTGRYAYVGLFGSPTHVPHTTAVHATPDHTRSRNVTVPNIGGSIGLSWKLQNFQMSFGYRADFFFNAMDGGIDARKSENRGFYGPYASISIGLGD